MKLDLKNITWKELPKETFTAKLNGKEYEVEIRALDGQELLELESLSEGAKIAFLLAKGLNITLQEATEIIKHDLSFTHEVSERIANLIKSYHEAMNDFSRGRYLTIIA